MNFHDYLEKQRARPVRERERLAVIWTAIGFSVILVVWIISFREMNKAEEPLPVDSPASLGDLKTDFLEGKNSIQDMMQDLPSQVPVETEGINPTGSAEGPGIDNFSGEYESDGSQETPQQSEVPQLP